MKNMILKLTRSSNGKSIYIASKSIVSFYCLKDVTPNSKASTKIELNGGTIHVVEENVDYIFELLHRKNDIK